MNAANVTPAEVISADLSAEDRADVMSAPRPTPEQARKLARLLFSNDYKTSGGCRAAA